MGVGLVVSGVDSQPVAEETPFETRFERIGHFGLEVGARSSIGGVDAPAGRNVGLRVGDEHRNVVAHAAPRQAHLGERHPFGQFEHLADDPRRAERTVEKPAALVRGVGQRRSPVVAPRDFEVETLGVFDRSRGEERLYLAAGVDLLVDVGRAVHDDIGHVEHIGVIERRGLRIDAQRIHRAVVQGGADRSAERPVGREPPVKEGQHLAVEKGLRITAFDVTAVVPGQRRSRRGVEPLADLVVDIVDVAAGADAQPAVHLPVGGEGGHDPVAQALAADAVGDPIGILFEIVARSDPFLHAEFAVRVIDLEMLAVGSHIDAARKTVKPDQRVHVESARHRFVLHDLTHEADVAVELDPVPEQPGRRPQVEVMPHQAVRARDSALGGIGVGEVGLHLLGARRDRQRVHRRNARPEKIPGVVVSLHRGARTPAFDAAAHPVTVLEVRQAERALERKVRSEGHGLPFRGAALLGRDQDHAVGGLTAVQRGRRGALEDRDALDVLGIEVRDAVAAVAVARIGDTPDGRIGLLRRRVENRHAVDHVQRLIVAGHRADAADADLGGGARTRRAFVYLHAGRLARERENHVRRLDVRELRSLDLVGRIGQVGIVAFQSQSRHDHVGDSFHVLLQRDVQPGAVFGRDTAGHIAHARDVEHGAGSDADGEFASGEGRHTVRSPVFHDGNPDKGRSRLIGNAAADHELPLRGLRPDFESGEQAQTERQDQSAE